LELEGYFLRKLNFSIDDGLLPHQDLPTDDAVRETNYVEAGVPIDYQPIALTVEPEVRLVRAEERLWRCDLTVKCGSPQKVKKSDLPYSLEVGFVGYFRLADSIPDEHADKLVRVNGPALLYSAAREVVLTLTSRSPGPSFLLPSVTFLTPATNPPTEAPKKRLASRKPSRKKSG
jgi:preprotein translocase subunit SecB